MATSGPPSPPDSSSSSLSQDSTDLERIIESIPSLSLDGHAEPTSKRFSIFGLGRSRSRISSMTNGNLTKAAAATAAATGATLAAAAAASPSILASYSREELFAQLSKQNRNIKKSAEEITKQVKRHIDIQSQVEGHVFKKESTQETFNLKTTLEFLCSSADERYPRIVVGLCEQFSFQDIISALKQIQSALSPIFQLKAIQLLADLITVDRFNNEEFLNDHFCESFSTLLAPRSDTYRPLFESLVQAKKESNRLLELLVIPNTHLPHHGLKPIDSLFPAVLEEGRLEDLAKGIANELRAQDLTFYRQVKAAEFRKIAWKQENKERTSPILLNQIALSDKISGFFINLILTASSMEKRILVVKLIVLLLQNLTEEKPYNFNAAMAISGALNHNTVDRLKLMEMLPEKYSKIWKKITDLLSNSHNYKMMREKSHPKLSLPFLGIFLRDLVFAIEKKSINNLCESVGNVYSGLFSHIDALRERDDILPQTLFCDHLLTLRTTNEHEEELMLLSYQIKPKQPALNGTTSAPTLTPIYDTSRSSVAAAAAAAAAMGSLAATSMEMSPQTANGPVAPHLPSQPLAVDTAASTTNDKKDKSKRKSIRGKSFIKSP